jgi:hypothetical protein
MINNFCIFGFNEIHQILVLFNIFSGNYFNISYYLINIKVILQQQNQLLCWSRNIKNSFKLFFYQFLAIELRFN